MAGINHGVLKVGISFKFERRNFVFVYILTIFYIYVSFDHKKNKHDFMTSVTNS